MNRVREGFSATAERGSDDRRDQFRKEMEATGRAELADHLIAGLNDPEGRPTLIFRPAGSGVISAVERLAELELDDPGEQLSVVRCHANIEKEALLGYLDSITGNPIPGRINDKTKICLLEDFDQLDVTTQRQLIEPIIEQQHGVTLYLTASGHSHGVIGAIQDRVGRVYQHQMPADIYQRRLAAESPKAEVVDATSAQDSKHHEHPEEGEPLKFREAIVARLLVAVDATAYQKALAKYHDYRDEMVAQPGFGTPEQRARGDLLSKEAREAADRAAESARQLARHPKEKLRDAAGHLLEVIEVTRPFGRGSS